MNNIRQLILRKRSLDGPTTEANVKLLVGELGLDAYHVRLVLAGDGLAKLLQGTSTRVQAAGRSLDSLGYQWCVVDVRKPRLRPKLVRAFHHASDALEFQGHFESVRLYPSDRLLIVLADLDGQLLGKLIRKTSFRDQKNITLTDREKYKAILASSPVIDLYVLSESAGAPSQTADGPLRFFPGKFDPSGLGELATLSAKQNLERVIQFLKEHMKVVNVELDFGLFQLPDCRLDTSRSKGAHETNLKSLLNYGWYLTNLVAQSKVDQGQAPGADNAAVAALGGLDAVTQALSGKPDAKASKEQAKIESDDTVLPPPPFGPKTVSHALLSAHTIRNFIIAVAIVGSLLTFTALSQSLADFLYFIGLKKGLFFFGTAAAFLYLAFRELRLKRWMDNLPTSKVRSLAMGMVEIKGVCQRYYNLISPGTMTPCVYFRLRKYQRQHFGDRKEWRMVEDTHSGHIPFYLRDETGRVLIDPIGSTVKPAHRQTLTGGYRSIFGVSTNIPEGMKWVEEIIPEGATAYVMGFAAYVHGLDDPLGRRVARKLRNLKQNSDQMLKYDADGDGQIDPQEWDAARSEMESKALEESLEEKAQPRKPEESAIIRKPEFGGLPFVISETAEEKLAVKHTFGVALFFIGTIGFSVLGVLALFGVLSMLQ